MTHGGQSDANRSLVSFGDSSVWTCTGLNFPPFSPFELYFFIYTPITTMHSDCSFISVEQCDTSKTSSESMNFELHSQNHKSLSVTCLKRLKRTYDSHHPMGRSRVQSFVGWMDGQQGQEHENAMMDDVRRRPSVCRVVELNSQQRESNPFTIKVGTSQGFFERTKTL